MRPCSVALLVNFVPPYRVALFQSLERELRRLTILVSTEMEADRPWAARWGGLDVRLLRSLSVPYRRRHPEGFTEDLSIHVSIDIIPRLLTLAPDVIISGEFAPRTLQACLYRRIAPLLGRRTRILVWATVSEQTERGRGLLRPFIRRLISTLADGVVTNGESGARYLRRIGFADSRIFRIHQSTDLARFESINRDPSGGMAAGGVIRLVSVGSLIERKGLEPFLESLVAWCGLHPGRPVHWRLIGDGPVKQVLGARKLPENLAVELLGNRDYHQVPALLADRDIMVFPTLADEWGLVVNEGMAAGLPVLASRFAQAAEEMVIDGTNGWLFDPTDRAATSAAMEKAFTVSPDRWTAMSKEAQCTAARFSHRNTLDRILHAVRTVDAA